jgi:hypothetical protein
MDKVKYVTIRKYNASMLVTIRQPGSESNNKWIECSIPEAVEMMDELRNLLINGGVSDEQANRRQVNNGDDQASSRI